MPTLVPTTIAGSLPKPEWLAPAHQLWAPWLLEGEKLTEGKRDAVRLALFDQEHAGIDIVTDGEQTRRHFVTTLIENLASATVTMPTFRSSSGPSRERTQSTSTTRISCAARPAAG